jgi:hypothetical protein
MHVYILFYYNLYEYKIFDLTTSNLFVSREAYVLPGPPRAGSVPGKNCFSVRLHNKGGPAKSVCTVSERLTLTCRMTWA